MTAEERKELARLKELEAKQKQSRQAQKQAYDELLEENVPELVENIIPMLEKLDAFKASIWKRCEILREQLLEIFDEKTDQSSWSFRTKNGDYFIRIGYNTDVKFDDSVNAGVAKIKEYIGSLADSTHANVLNEMVTLLMRPTKTGSLNPRRLLELAEKKAVIHDPLFHEGIDIILASQQKTKGSTYIEIAYRVTTDTGEAMIERRI